MARSASALTGSRRRHGQEHLQTLIKQARIQCRTCWWYAIAFSVAMDSVLKKRQYHSGALTTGQHHVVLTELEDGGNGLVTLDYATVRTYAVPDKPAANTSSTIPGTVTVTSITPGTGTALASATAK
jgi:hypothetical protein